MFVVGVAYLTLDVVSETGLWFEFQFRFDVAGLLLGGGLEDF
jgi:hypothetical protein